MIALDTAAGWESVPIGAACLKTAQVDPTKTPAKRFRYIDVSCVSNNSFSIIGATTLTGADAPSRARKVVQAEDVIFATVRPALRRVARVPARLEGEICSTGFCVLRPDPRRLDSGFLYYYLLTQRVARRMEALQDGATYPAIRDSDLLNEPMPLPPLAEQRAIARAVRAVQEAHAARRREAELERERKAALMAHLFTHGTRAAPPRQTEIGALPANWRMEKVGSFCTSSAVGPRFAADFYEPDGNVATLRTTDIDDEGNISYGTMPRARLDIAKFADHVLRPNDFLVTRSGTCGIASVWTDYTERPVLPGAFLIRFRFTDGLRPAYLRCYFNSTIGRSRVLALAAGAIQQNITSTSIKNLSVPLPDVDEQAEIVEVAERFEGRIAALEQEIKLLDELFRELLEELMTGRLSAVSLID